MVGTDSVYVLEGVTIAAFGDDAYGIYAGSGTQQVAIFGTAISDLEYAIELFGSGHDVFIAKSGSVYGYSGIYCNLGSNIDIQGSLDAAHGAGIVIQAGDNFINIGATGTMTSEATGIVVNGFYGGTNNKVVNAGAITTMGTSFSHGVDFSSQPDQEHRLVNLGVISATGEAVHGEGGNETVINSGTLDGGVDLGGGNDFLRNTGQGVRQCRFGLGP